MRPLDPRLLRRTVARALVEDIGRGDVTTSSIVDPDAEGAADLCTREACVVAGLPVVEEVYRQVDPDIHIATAIDDGVYAKKNDILAEVRGPLAGILVGERVALNFLQRLSGVATLTNKYVRAIRGTHAEVCDTRKTTPGLRALEKYAVTMGGGANHRFGLDDGILIKDNHLLAIDGETVGVRIAEAIAAARDEAPHTLLIEVECETLEEVEAALEFGADAVLLDNMRPARLRKAVDICREFEGVIVEASGGVTLDTVKDIAETGVDLISVGALTHSAPAIDIGLDVRAA